MAIRVALNHKTEHRYAKPVWLSPQVIRLRPAPHCRTPILSYSLTIKPSEHFINWQQDPYANYQARCVFPKKTRQFSVEVDLIADMTVINPFDFFIEGSAETFPFEYGPVLSRELAPYLHTEPAGEKLAEFIAAERQMQVPTVNYLVDLNQRLARKIQYLIRLEPGIQTAEQTLTCMSGSCRDTSWLLVQTLRHLGLATRFVSGYLVQLVADIQALEGPVGASKDFVDLHAWVEVYLPGAGWIGLDPTSGMLTAEGHIPLACSAEPSSAAAISGYFSVDNQSVTESDPGEKPLTPDTTEDAFHFGMSVTRIHEDARVTKPYSPEQWEAINAVGRQVDGDLRRTDVRLTMGGEPTFVSLDDADAPEWNGEALGPRKYEIGDQLLRRLRDRFAPGGFLHHGQGKWYPGEQLPRWAFGLYWRRDGKPIWHDPALVADAAKPNGFTDLDARLFITHLAWRLKVDAKHIQPGYEDAWFFLWKEQRLPVNVDPFDSKLADPLARARLARVYEQGLDKVVGYCLPLARRHYRDGSAKWISSPWFFRPERMYLVPGDSPMGFRLPLESIPWVAPSDFPHLYERDPMEARGPLPSAPRGTRAPQMSIAGAPEPSLARGHVEQMLAIEDLEEMTEPATVAVAETMVRGSPQPTTDRGGFLGDSNGEGNGHALGDGAAPALADLAQPIAHARPAPGRSSADTVRTALCAEARKGVLHIFVPPLRDIEDYLDLVAAIEETAGNLKMPVLVEGYTPPFDPRINDLKVTPDPGVIEVNTQPAASWDELVHNLMVLDEEARRCRLGTEKFMIDGRHTGTGGGNHIVFGGAKPSDSPLLRRPHLLRSMLGYWHNHPALSYLFSGTFVGPTSQAPRVDEARNDQVYELEIAFSQVKDFEQVPPWLVDRIFRNLLVDSTGNTHRAEFCIDKLYAPESPTGRLGLLEMRGFEMPPHPRMSLAQHLLLRALIARFWEKPYNKPLVRWRTEIHDRFLLPHFVQQDLNDVVEDLNDWGYPIRSEWFGPHVEFRFPVLGSITPSGVSLEIRQAIEPWHVLGETPGIGSTVRFVDSSLERVQVLVSGMTESRHKIAVNGVSVPLHPTGTNGQFVAGVRYRAWQPASCLHPTVGRHSPLVFDVIDTWSGRSIGGCRYHVSHPGGRNYSTRPVNAYEAESRRMARFYKFGHTPGPMRLIDAQPSREFPLTLDLRRY